MTIAAVSKAVRDRVEAALRERVPVVLADPTKAEAGSISIWLYQVAVDEFSRNRPVAQVETAGGRASRLRLPPLGVNLTYLVTPIFDDQETAQNRLADVMLALYETPQFAVESADAGVNEFVRVSCVPDNQEDRAKIWESLSKPYRLSVCYQVRTARLFSNIAASDAPIVSTTSGLSEKAATEVVSA